VFAIPGVFAIPDGPWIRSLCNFKLIVSGTRTAQTSTTFEFLLLNNSAAQVCMATTIGRANQPLTFRRAQQWGERVQQWVAERFAGIRDHDGEGWEEVGGVECIHLGAQQKLLRAVMAHEGDASMPRPLRGLLLFHGVGLGKTCTSIAIAESIGVVRGRKVYVILPASLEFNYVDGLLKCAVHRCKQALHWSRGSDGEWRGAEATYDGASGSRPNLDALSPMEQEQVDASIMRHIRSDYTFLHFGLTLDRLSALTKSGGGGAITNPFDGAVVVVDEAHNLTSAVTNRRKVSSTLYDMLLRAKGCRIVLLTATPLINSPVELAHVVNLLRGPLRRITLRDVHPSVLGTLVQAAHAHPLVEEVEESRLDTTRCLVLTFASDPDTLGDSVLRELSSSVGEVMKVEKAALLHLVLPTDPDVFLERYVNPEDGGVRRRRQLAAAMSGCISSMRMEEDSSATSRLPRVHDLQVIEVPMSGWQFDRYIQLRSREMSIEKNRARQASMWQPHRNSRQRDDRNTRGDAFVRPFSRAACNFAFPQGVQREFLSTMKKEGRGGDLSSQHGDKQEEDEDDEDDTSAEGTAGRTSYLEYRSRLLHQLWTHHQHALRMDGVVAGASSSAAAVGDGGQLPKHSPKFAEVVRRIQNVRAPVLLYSQFRTLEGVALMALVLRANGFRPLVEEDEDPAAAAAAGGRGDRSMKKRRGGVMVRMWEEEDLGSDAPRYAIFDPASDTGMMSLAAFNGDLREMSKWYALQEDAAAGVDIHSLAAMELKRRFPDGNRFGQICRVLFVTRSGAEGINLKGVRQVHILEPYWHMIRVQQVIGRATRMDSHAHLPPDERDVQVFLYISSATAEQFAMVPDLSRYDSGRTSDQYVWQRALLKQHTLVQLQELMRRSSVDCLWQWQRNNPGDPGHPPCLQQLFGVDDDDDGTGEEGALPPLMLVRIDGSLYLLQHTSPSSGKLYDYRTFRRDGSLKQVGDVIKQQGRSGNFQWTAQWKS
jgi:hypothetical protein